MLLLVPLVHRPHFQQQSPGAVVLNLDCILELPKDPYLGAVSLTWAMGLAADQKKSLQMILIATNIEKSHFPEGRITKDFIQHRFSTMFEFFPNIM